VTSQARESSFAIALDGGVVGERPDYPAAFVSDGRGIITLWQVESPDTAIAFDRRANVGLHHLAIAVVDRAGLDVLYQRVSNWLGVVVEFGPQLLAPARRSTSSYGSRAACGSSLPSILASRACASHGKAVRAAIGRGKEETL
jgi:hypothetical protein